MLILSTLAISGCSSTKDINITTKSLEKVPLTLPPVDKINLDKIDWIIVTEKNFKEVFADLDRKNFDPVIFGLSDRGYESLSVNTAKIKQLVEQQRLIIIAYEEYYKKTNDSIDEFNKEEEKPQEQEETLVGKIKSIF